MSDDMARLRDEVAGVLRSDQRYLTDTPEALTDALLPLLARKVAEARGEALREALSGVTTHNGTPVTPKNLRWAATHEALCRSFIFDVLTGLADALDEETTP